MKWEKKHTLEETVEWKGLPESEMAPFKFYVNSKFPGICGTYAAACLTVLMAKREGVVTQSMDELLKGMERRLNTHCHIVERSIGTCNADSITSGRNTAIRHTLIYLVKKSCQVFSKTVYLLS